MRELSFGVGPSILVFKTNGRIHAGEEGEDDNDGAAPELPAPAGLEEEEGESDVVFGAFVPSKWTYDMTKKDDQGLGCDGTRFVDTECYLHPTLLCNVGCVDCSYFVFRLEPGAPARIVLDDGDVRSRRFSTV